MAKMTLLEIVQSVLNAADEDSVNAIDDTEASDSATIIAKEVYFDYMSSADWPHLMNLEKLDSVSDVTQPTTLQVPETITLLDHQEFFQYDVTETGDTVTTYRDVEYKPPGDFMRMLRSRNDSDTNVTKYTGYNSIDLLIRTDKMPEFWTSFDDAYIIMDSFHSSTESTLQGTKTSIMAKKIPTWTQTDVAIPDMPDNLFPSYLARCKVKYNAYFTQKDNPLDQLEAHSGQSRQRNKGHTTAGRNHRRKYGRNRPRS